MGAPLAVLRQRRRGGDTGTGSPRTSENPKRRYKMIDVIAKLILSFDNRFLYEDAPCASDFHCLLLRYPLGLIRYNARSAPTIHLLTSFLFSSYCFDAPSALRVGTVYRLYGSNSYRLSMLSIRVRLRTSQCILEAHSIYPSFQSFG